MNGHSIGAWYIGSGTIGDPGASTGLVVMPARNTITRPLLDTEAQAAPLLEITAMTTEE